MFELFNIAEKQDKEGREIN